jgi:lipopolysaccharide/colanic/teichoic acid biosynthesis glycosyltransferase
MSTHLTPASDRTPHSDRRRGSSAQDRSEPGDRCLGLLDQGLFQSILTLERKRSERSQKPFALMLIDASSLLANGTRERILHGMSAAVASATRDTDVIGWYQGNAILGVIYTEIDGRSKEVIAENLCRRMNSGLEAQLGSRSKQIGVSVHLFPEVVSGNHSGLANPKFYSDLPKTWERRRGALLIKRAIDVAGSGLLLILLLPIFAAIAVAIKLTSKGPIFFKQERLGRFGVPFICLKFRTMYLSNSPKLHQDYIQKFIAGKDLEQAAGRAAEQAQVYKITNDPRVTRVGKFLRSTSFDELPQLWNVLVGQMSLVGPRPPVRYEYELYHAWQRRRVLEAKPGITGLWQVSGRSRVRFDEMVRLDLRYWRSWSLWSDLVILFRTPRAVFSRDGAY